MHRIAFPTGFDVPAAAAGGSGAAAAGPAFSQIGEHVIITGPEAEHAVRVKRVGTGEVIELLDGRGGVAVGKVVRVEAGKGGKGRSRAGLEVVIESTATVAHLRPRIEVWSATPKGARVDELVDGLSQAGAAAWVPMRTERGVVGLARESKLERLERVAWESAKQCGRAWLLEIGEEQPLSVPPRREWGRCLHIVVADAGGMPYTASGAEVVRVLVGPEGGWSAGEREQFRAAGVAMASFGPHAMRIETAAVVAAGVVFDVEARVSPRG